MADPVRGTVADPVALQASVRRRNEALRKAVLEDAVEGSGDRDEWLSRTRRVALDAAQYSLEVGLDLARQRRDPAALQQADVVALADEDRRASDRVHDLTSGNHGLQEWFKRAQQIGFAAASHASRAAEHCDAATVEAVASEIGRGMTEAVSSSTGSGGVQYWADKTGEAATGVLQRTRMTRLSTVAAEALRSASGQPTGGGVPLEDVQARLSRHRERLLESLERDAYGPEPNASSDALMGTLLAGGRAMAYAGHVSLETARLRSDALPPDDAVLSDLAARADKEIQAAARLGLQGSGTASYWFECAATIAARSAAFAGLAATSCNGAMLDAVRAPLEGLLSQVPASTHGDVHAWMKAAGAAAEAVIPAIQEVITEARAVAQAQRSRPGQPIPADGAARERHKLETDLSLQNERLAAWDDVLKARGAEATALQTRVNALYQRVEPFTALEKKAEGRSSQFSRIALGGLATAAAGGLLAMALPAVGTVVAVVGGCILGGGLIGRAHAEHRKALLAAERAPLEEQIEDIAPSLVTARDLSNLASRKAKGAEQAIVSLGGKLDVHRMADAANRKPGDADVQVDEETVKIGSIVIKRKRVSDRDRVQ